MKKQKKILLAISIIVICLLILIFVFPYPRRTDEYGKFIVHTYWMGVPPLIAFPGGGSDVNYHHGFIVLRENGNPFTLRATYVKQFMFENVYWTDSSITIQRWRPEPPIEWKF